MTKHVGTSLYLEFRHGYRTAQVLIIPPLKNPVSDVHEPLRVLTRQISELNPRRSWRFYNSPARIDALPTEDILVATFSTIPLINDIAPFLAGFATSDWSLYQKPVAVEMSTDDLSDVSNGETPAALMRRILRARSEAGYEEALFSSTTTTA